MRPISSYISRIRIYSIIFPSIGILSFVSNNCKSQHSEKFFQAYDETNDYGPLRRTLRTWSLHETYSSPSIPAYPSHESNSTDEAPELLREGVGPSSLTPEPTGKSILSDFLDANVNIDNPFNNEEDIFQVNLFHS